MMMLSLNIKFELIINLPPTWWYSNRNITVNNIIITEISRNVLVVLHKVSFYDIVGF